MEHLQRKAAGPAPVRWLANGLLLADRLRDTEDAREQALIAATWLADRATVAAKPREALTKVLTAAEVLVERVTPVGLVLSANSEHGYAEVLGALAFRRWPMTTF